MNDKFEIQKVEQLKLSKELVAFAKANPALFKQSMQRDLPEPIKIDLYFNDDATIYLVILPMMERDLNDSYTETFVGGHTHCFACVGTFATASTLGSYGVGMSTASSLSSISSASSAKFCNATPQLLPAYQLDKVGALKIKL